MIKTIKRSLDNWKECIGFWQLDFPQKITDEYIKEIETGDPRNWHNFSRWGFCYRDLSQHDLSELSEEYLNQINFNSSTIWPDRSKMPKGFEPDKLLSQRKTPMMGVESLHEKGIQGQGITIAVLDGPINIPTHVEFEDASIEVCDKLIKPRGCHFHGECVLANLVGKNIGIAPKANVIYYAVEGAQTGISLKNQAHLNALKEILKRIENGEHIQIVNISGPLYDKSEDLNEIKELLDVVETLKSKGCTVIHSGVYGKYFDCGCLPYNCDYNDIDKVKFNDYVKGKRLVGVISGGKLVPEFLSDTGYQYEYDWCFSWSIPQVVGLYALCLQVNNSLTFEDFVNLSRQTSYETQSGEYIFMPTELVKAAEKFKRAENLNE